MKICDVHAHVFPDKIAEKAADSIGQFYGIPMVGNGSVSLLKKWHDEAGIGHAWIHSVAVAPRNVAAINTFIAATVADDPERFTGFAAIHPDCADFPALMDEVKALGLRGFKIHPDMQRFALDSPEALNMFSYMRDAGLPVLIHTGDDRYAYSNPPQMLKVLENFPDLRCICAHMGGYTVWEEASEAFAPYENVWMDTSSSLAFLDPGTAVRVIRRYDPTRVFFGTDYPMWNASEELQRFLALPLTSGEQERILWENAEAFLK